jgi:hypothetical protein
MLLSFGIFFPFWYAAPRKIWQPWFPSTKKMFPKMTVAANKAELKALDEVAPGAADRGLESLNVNSAFLITF